MWHSRGRPAGRCSVVTPLIDIGPQILANFPVTAVRTVPEIVLHTARPGSGLRRLGGPAAPYWAYPWAGGIALARYVLDHRECVLGKRVLDLGSGSGLVGIAALKAGARSALAAETDPRGRIALTLNAAANGVTLPTVEGDVLEGELPQIDSVLAGDIFYNARLARRVTLFLDRCQAAGIAVLVGDPKRSSLPANGLDPIACYSVPDFGEGSLLRPAWVFSWVGKKSAALSSVDMVAKI